MTDTTARASVAPTSVAPGPDTLAARVTAAPSRTSGSQRAPANRAAISARSSVCG